MQLPDIKRNKFYVVIDPGHGGPDLGTIGIGGLRETDVVLDVSKRVNYFPRNFLKVFAVCTYSDGAVEKLCGA